MLQLSTGRGNLVLHACMLTCGFADDHVIKDPVLNRDDRYFLSDDEAFDAAAKKAVHSIELQKKMEISNRAERYYFRTYAQINTHFTSPNSISLSLSELLMRSCRLT